MHVRHPWHALLVAGTAAVSIPTDTAAQCGHLTVPAGAPANFNGPVFVMASWDPDGPGPRGPVLVAGGAFTHVGTTLVNHIARYDEAANAWLPFATPAGTGCDNDVRALCDPGDGTLLFGGDFTMAGGSAHSHVARWSGSTVLALGGGVNGSVRAICTTQGGDVIVGGQFSAAGGVAASSIAAWNGNAWSPLASGVTGTVHALATLTSGDVLTGGQFTCQTTFGPSLNLVSWDGSAWRTVVAPPGLGLTPDTVRALVSLPGNGWVAGGDFTVIGFSFVGTTLLFDGSQLRLMPQNGFADVHALAVLPDGDIAAGGVAGGVGPGGGVQVARWNGNTWSEWPGDIRSGSATGAAVHTLARRPDGTLAVGGEFQLASTAGTWRAAGIQSTCPATATSSGSGCGTVAGTLQLTAQSPPWIGGTFVARVQPVLPQWLAFRILGWGTQSVPLPSLHPLGGAGCNLLVTHDSSLLVPAAGGAATWEIQVPDNVGLVGLGLHAQVVVAELDNSGALIRLSSSNRLSIRVGAY